MIEKYILNSGFETIEAVQFNISNVDEIKDWAKDNIKVLSTVDEREITAISIPHHIRGNNIALKGDYILKLGGEFVVIPENFFKYIDKKILN